MFSNIAKTLKMMSNEERQSFDWRRPEDEVTDEEVLVIPFNAVERVFAG